MQNYFPVFLDLRGRKVLVIGAGQIAEGKIKQLLELDAVKPVQVTTSTCI